MSNPVVLLSVFFILLGGGFLLWKVMMSGSFFKDLSQRKKTLVEDILKQLYHVEYGGRTASLNAMAGALKLADRKLIGLVEEMSRDQLIRLDQNILELTPEGRAYALKIIRVHRLWEKYLSERTGFDKSEWHDRAERKEHVLNEEETEKLYRELGNPRFDPHGDPIPTEQGEIIDTNWRPLSSLTAGARVAIAHLEDEPEVVYEQIVEQNLHRGSQLEVLTSNDEEVSFHSEGKDYSFSPIVASNISVRELNPDETYDATIVRLSGLVPGEKATITGLSPECRGANRRRLLDLGFIPGSVIETEFENPLKEPKAYSIRNTIIALRDKQADLILIRKENE